jgi:hypothetical protein
VLGVFWHLVDPRRETIDRELRDRCKVSSTGEPPAWYVPKLELAMHSDATLTTLREVYRLVARGVDEGTTIVLLGQ